MALNVASTHTDAPPSYAESQATGSSSAPTPTPTFATTTTAAARRSQASHSPSPVRRQQQQQQQQQQQDPSRLGVNIPAAHRRSMEDEARPLPDGWIRLFDPKENHQFFVDTKANPPRSIWQHPYDDEEYLASISSEERERIQDEEARLRRAASPSSSEEKLPYAPPTSSPSKAQAQLSQDTSTKTNTTTTTTSTTASHGTGKRKTLSERLKEKATGMTKEERLADRQKRAEQERQFYEAHVNFRNALAEATRTGQPVFFMKDRDGRDVYVEPPTVPSYGGGGGGGGGAYPYATNTYGGPASSPAGQYYYGQAGSYGINPYASGVYANPNARFIRPQQPYVRPYRGSGLSYGLPIAGGLLAGGLLGAALF